MGVQDVLRQVGQWSIQLLPDTPPGVAAALDYFGHVAIVPGRVNPVERGDEMLGLARYVGVLRSIEATEQVTLSGVGMESWLGDEEKKGDIVEPPGVILTASTFANAVRAVLPAHGAITEGTIYPGVPGTITSTHIYQTPRDALDYICNTMKAEWAVTNDGKLNAGLPASLFRMTPTCVVIRKSAAGFDQSLRSLPGSLAASRDVNGYVTRVVVVSTDLGNGAVNATTVPFKDIHGNNVYITTIADEQNDTQTVSATARAQVLLDKASVVRRSFRLSTDEFDVAGDFSPGDMVWCYDPEAGIFDLANEVTFRGRVINPAAVRVLSLTWPVSRGFTVGFRSANGTWTDLSPWVAWESELGGELEVADSASSAFSSSSTGGGTQVANTAGDTSVPAVPVFGAFTTSSYQGGDGLSRAQISIQWTRPLNVDGSTIVDGDHYEIRYRPFGVTNWSPLVAAWDATTMNVVDLSPATTYEFQIRAVDNASPTNYGAWSATTSFLSSVDTVAPATPAAPTVAGSMIAVQITHTLGLASGGTFNLPLDMNHLEVHASTTTGFTPSTATLLGKLPVNAGMITAQIPAVGTFDVAATVPVFVRVIAVDNSGNRSITSAQVTSTATLIDDAHISNLTVSKVTAGTLTAAVILGGSIKTATTGQRIEMDNAGIRGYDTAGNQLTGLSSTGTFLLKSAASGARVEIDTLGIRLYNAAGATSINLSAATGNASITGVLQTAVSGQRIVVDAGGNGTIYFFPATGTDYAFINAPSQNTIGVNSGTGGTAFSTRMWATTNAIEMRYMNSATEAQAGGIVFANNVGANLNMVNGGTVNVNATSSSMWMPSGSSVTVSAGVASTGTTQTMRATAGSMTCTSSGDSRFSSDAGTAIFGAANSTYVQCNGTSTYISGPSGSSRLNFSSSGVARFDAVAFQSSGILATSVAANMFYQTSNNQIYYSTSSRVVKRRIENIDVQSVIDGVLKLRPVTFYDKRLLEEADDDTSKVSQQIGLIAEEVQEIDGIVAELLSHPADPDTDRLAGVHYERLAVALLPVIHDLRERIAALESA